LLRRVLELRSGTDFSAVRQSNLGLELAQRVVPDLILLDLHLSDMAGEDVLCVLKADFGTRHIPVVIVSGKVAAGHREKMLNAGAEAVLLKPFSVAEFLDVVDEVFREHPRAGAEAA
jgi:CheY-like chemotaxis protein